jgi:hypothetical protein
MTYSTKTGSNRDQTDQSTAAEADISKMDFSHWKPPGVSERIWSGNLDSSISGEYQTLGEHDFWPSE